VPREPEAILRSETKLLGEGTWAMVYFRSSHGAAARLSLAAGPVSNTSKGRDSKGPAGATVMLVTPSMALATPPSVAA
jgi:hypothetical protein